MFKEQSAQNKKVSFFKSPLRFDQLFHRIVPDETVVGEKVFKTERMAPTHPEIIRDVDALVPKRLSGYSRF